MYTWLKSCSEISFIRVRATTLLKKNKRLERPVVPRVTQNESSLSVKLQRIGVVFVHRVACVSQACNALRVHLAPTTHFWGPDISRKGQCTSISLICKREETVGKLRK